MWLIVIMIIFLGGIIFITSQTSTKKIRSEEFFKSLEEFLEGKLQPLEGQPGAFKIDFIFHDQPFVYEDLSDYGFEFGEEARKAYLRTPTGTNFLLYFTQMQRSATIKKDVLIASNIPHEPIVQRQKVIVPPSLKGLNVHTNDIQLANRLFADKKVVNVFSAFRSVDPRGSPSVALKIIDGMVILEFHSAQWKIPHYQALVYNVSSIEDYLEDLIKIVRAIKG